MTPFSTTRTETVAYQSLEVEVAQCSIRGKRTILVLCQAIGHHKTTQTTADDDVVEV